MKLILSWDCQTPTNFINSVLTIIKVDNVLNCVDKCVIVRMPENFKTYFKTKIVRLEVKGPLM